MIILESQCIHIHFRLDVAGLQRSVTENNVKRIFPESFCRDQRTCNTSAPGQVARRVDHQHPQPAKWSVSAGSAAAAFSHMILYKFK